jgi:hypothetical protein
MKQGRVRTVFIRLWIEAGGEIVINLRVRTQHGSGG